MASYCILPFFVCVCVSTIPAWEILVPWSGMELMPPALEAQSPIHWTARGSPHTICMLRFEAVFFHLTYLIWHSSMFIQPWFIPFCHWLIFHCMGASWLVTHWLKYLGCFLFWLYAAYYILVNMWACLAASDSVQPHGLYLPSSPVRGIVLARILEWVAISSSRSSWPRDRLMGY